MRALLLSVVVISGLAACGDSPPPQAPRPPPPITPAPPSAPPASIYPAPPKGDVTYDLFGIKVADPYRPLEDMDAPATRTWLAAENQLTDRTLPIKPEFRTSLARLTQMESNGAPLVKGGKWFWKYDSGKVAQPSLVMATSEGGPAKVILDPNVLSPDGKQSFTHFVVSEDGARIAYGMSTEGGDWTTWHVRDLATGKDLPDELPNVKYYAPSFTKDGKALYYSRFPAPTPGRELTEADHDSKVFVHVIGSPASADKVVYERPDRPSHQFMPFVSEDGQYLVIEVGDGEVGDRTLEEILVIDLLKPDAKPVVIGEGFTSDNWYLGSEGTRFFVQTNEGAPNKKVVAIDLKTPDKAHWKDVVPNAPLPIEQVTYVGRQFFVHYFQDSHLAIRAFDANGDKVRDLQLPGIGSGSVVGGAGKNARSTYLSFETYIVPSSAYRYDLDTGKITPFRPTKLPFDPALYEITQAFYPGRDGTKIPITISAKKGQPHDGTTPLLLTGYGSFGLSYWPHFAVKTIAWLEHGGAFAVANVRGGGEYGAPWRFAGYREKKQTTWDDFEAAAAWLAAQKITSASRLGIFGSSGGGLMMGAVETQHPELFGAVAPLVGVHDMLRFQLFGEGAGWQGDLGSPSVEKEARAIYAYSPLHNVHAGTRYPATYIVTSDHDVRVAPLHSYKFAAAMQAAQAGPAPILLRVRTTAGHGGATTRDARNDNDAELLTFFARYLESAP